MRGYDQPYQSIGQIFGTTANGELGTHVFTVPTVPLNERVMHVDDVDKTCNVVCGPKVCKGYCGRPAFNGHDDRWVVREGIAAEDPSQVVPYGMTAFDMCHFNSLTGAIQMMLRAAIFISCVCCIGRSDFKLPVLLHAYYEWSVCGDWQRDKKIYRVQDRIPVSHVYERTSGLLVANQSTILGVGLSTVLLFMVAAVDGVFLLFSAATWTCLFAQEDDCLYGGLQQTQKMHEFVLGLSFVNFLLTLVLAAASWAWLRIQKRSLQFLESTTI